MVHDAWCMEAPTPLPPCQASALTCTPTVRSAYRAPPPAAWTALGCALAPPAAPHTHATGHIWTHLGFRLYPPPRPQPAMHSMVTHCNIILNAFMNQ